MKRRAKLDWSDPEQVRAYNRAYYAANKERYRGYRAKDDPVEKAAYHADYFAEHKAEFREYRQAYKQRDPERFKRQTRGHYDRHRDQILARGAKWKRENPERMRAAIKAWGKQHPEQLRSYGRKHRLLKLGNGGWHTVEEWLEKCELFAWCCAYCGEAKPLEEDHAIPLVRGGSDDIMNILPACRSCNARKNTKTAAEYLLLTAVSR